MEAGMESILHPKARGWMRGWNPPSIPKGTDSRCHPNRKGRKHPSLSILFGMVGGWRALGTEAAKCIRPRDGGAGPSLWRHLCGRDGREGWTAVCCVAQGSCHIPYLWRRPPRGGGNSASNNKVPLSSSTSHGRYIGTRKVCWVPMISHPSTSAGGTIPCDLNKNHLVRVYLFLSSPQSGPRCMGMIPYQGDFIFHGLQSESGGTRKMKYYHRTRCTRAASDGPAPVDHGANAFRPRAAMPFMRAHLSALVHDPRQQPPCFIAPPISSPPAL